MNGKRLLASLLTVLLLLALLPAAALAEESVPEAQPIPDETQDDSLTGFFLVGSMNGWTPSEAYRFTWESYDATTGVQWLLLCTLNAGDEFKAVQVENGSIVTWYPAGTNNNYVVDAAQEGEKAVYFRPDDTGTWGSHFKVEDPPTYHVSTKVNSTVHGSISVSPEDAHAGEPITVTVTPDEGYILQYIEAPAITKVNDSTYTFPMPGYATTVYATFKLAPGFYFDNTNRVVPDYYVPEEKFSPSASPFGEWERETVLTEGNYLDVKAVYAPALATEKTGYYWCFQTMKLTYSSSSSRPKVTAEQAGHAMVFLTETEREGYIKAIHLESTYKDPSFIWDAWITVKNFHPINIDPAEHGTVTAPADAYESQPVTLTVTPAEGYELDTLTVVDAEGHEISVEGNSFTMPDMPVTVTASFKETVDQIDYPLWLGEIQVNSLNKDDILGDGSVSYDPITSTLHFAAAEPVITGLHDNGLTGKKQVLAQIYADGIDLIIDAPSGLKLSTEGDYSYNIYAVGPSTLTVNGDLDFVAGNTNIYAFHTDYVQNGDLTLRAPINGLNAASIKLTGDLDAEIGRIALYASAGTTEITGDTIHAVTTDGTYAAYGIYGESGVTLTGAIDIESIHDCVKTGAGNAVVTINGEAALKSTTYGIEGFSVIVNGDLDLETGQDGIYVKPGSGYIEIHGNVNGKCTNKYPYYAVVKGQNITIDGDVNAESLGYGILAENGGVVTVAGGTWTLDGGKSAISAKGGIVIPETHSIIEPAGGTVGQSGSAYHILQPDGSVATHAVISGAASTVTVSFDAGEGTVEPATKEVNAGEAIGELPTPTREGGWVFLGWYTAPAATAFDIGQGTEVTAETTFEEDATVYAHWRLPGDVNGDGKVNATDVSLLTTFVKARGSGVAIVPFSGDVNGDGKVNATDVSLLTTYVKARGNGVVLH
jgi:hypothetical protein